MSTGLGLLTFSTLYPSERRPHHGVFVETRLRQLVAGGVVRSTVLAPVPWYPSWAPEHGRWIRSGAIPAIEYRHGLVVHHPRHVAIPRIGMTVAPALLAASGLAWLARRSTAERADYDLVDAHYVYPDGVAAVALARTLRRPLVITARGSDVTQLPDHAGPRLMIRRAIRAADALIAVSSALGQRLVELGADPARVHVLRNGVDLELFTPPADRAQARRQLGLGDGPVLLSVGHLIERKGHDRVITALTLLPGSVQLLVVGEGPLDGELRALAERLGVAGRVRFLGLLPPHALPAIYGAADLLVLASSREGWANVLLEAMACGTRVVASPIPGNPEVVRSAAAGVIADSNTPVGLAAAIAALLRSPADRDGARAYAEGFGWDAVSAGQLTVFRTARDRYDERRTARRRPVSDSPRVAG
ncbi:glycosyltransferase [Lichenicola sp.]|uniref:glycosyltransferase n=1 Tax=Lichenicola sp. TaxID=2804529 RepID=UPI003B00D4F6